jgi:hypothetical protein
MDDPESGITTGTSIALPSGVGTSPSKDPKKKKSVIPEGLLPSYLANAFGDIYEEDGLLVLGKGLGWLTLLASFVRFYADVEDGHVSILEDADKKGTYKSTSDLLCRRCVAAVFQPIFDILSIIFIQGSHRWYSFWA